MKVFRDYTQRLNSAMTESSFGHFEKAQTIAEKRMVNNNKPLPSLEELSQFAGVQPRYQLPLGAHPDFAHLKNGVGIEQHYIVSAFIDIKGSTNLFKKYPPASVAIITQTIQMAAIHCGLIFGGYVQRLQGDSVFLYFGGKAVPPEVAVQQALNATSIFSYYVKTELRRQFEANGVQPLYTRTGIDVGEDVETIWTLFGMEQTSEVTTCSLHTSLASKMQAHAENNGIVIGDNVIEKGRVPQHLVSSCDVRNRPRYIYEDVNKNFRYSQWDLNWMQFLKRHSWIATMDNDVLEVKTPIVVRDPEALKPVGSLNKPFKG